MDKQNNKSCEICYKIICNKCGWEADDEAVLEIQKGNITACPECGWTPS
jgi:hypothetical protein